MQKLLGKIESAEFGTIPDHPHLLGLQLEFSGPGWHVGDGGKFSVNVSSSCKWEKSERDEALTKLVDTVDEILKQAKVHKVSELVKKPVEITIEDGMFKDFRILTEVL